MPQALPELFLDALLDYGAVLHQVLRLVLTNLIFYNGLHLGDKELGFHIVDADVPDDIGKLSPVIDIVQLGLDPLHCLGILGVGIGVHLVHLLPDIHLPDGLDKGELEVQPGGQGIVHNFTKLVFHADVALVDDGKGGGAYNRYHRRQKHQQGGAAQLFARVLVPGDVLLGSFGGAKIHIHSFSFLLGRERPFGALLLLHPGRGASGLPCTTSVPHPGTKGQGRSLAVFRRFCPQKPPFGNLLPRSYPPVCALMLPYAPVFGQDGGFSHTGLSIQAAVSPVFKMRWNEAASPPKMERWSNHA